MIEVKLFGSYGAQHTPSGLFIDMNGKTRIKDPIGPLCRLLQEHGYEGLVRITRDGTPVFKNDLDLSFWAGLDFVDEQTKSAKCIKYRPFGWSSPEEISEKGRA
ncbi:hypothetical protein CU103_12410 [Phyllobacterium sophorae]|uniref:Uncharacterized protein n=1 Tax=Phyllobacterium sophorae TaxID=1520277 RepID=A0A2P7BE28_9HYPH|nr:hypothetical protein CU103_12410 [Phyllobacterium sophorae]